MTDNTTPGAGPEQDAIERVVRAMYATFGTIYDEDTREVALSVHKAKGEGDGQQ